ncbi:MAG: serine kinase [Bacteroides sp.]|nr:serine kinase [Prevotella sp.]MCM1407983.1 hypothetical protein [Treponema brennaborense]MCM1468959.1 serine kinase [Bacteroides sp.]
MKTGDLVQKLNLSVVQDLYENKEISAAYTSDLLSDAMGNAPDECVLITIQAHKNTVAVASLKDSPCIIICNSRPVPDDMIEAAKEERIGIFTASENQFTVSGKLYNLLIG